MVVLALDTTTTAGSCALVRGGRLLHEQASEPSRPTASRLPGELAALLDREGVSLREVDVLAVGVGPGSFTGLRVGIAAMQGLAVALRRPLIGVSALDALARIASGGPDPSRVRIATWIDAWRGEVYAALYEGRQAVEPATVGLPEQLLRRIGGRPTLFTGDGAVLHQTAISAALGVDALFADPVAPLLSGAMAIAAMEEFRAGRSPAPDAIRPLYIRRSDAELARDRG